MTRTIRALAAAVATMAAGSGATALAADEPMRLRFSLPREAVTSAGVYDTEGRLVRTLWRGETLLAGPHEALWDRRDDRGMPAAPGTHTVRLVHHRMQYVWEGVVGNSSTATAGVQKHRAHWPVNSLLVIGEQVHYAVAYNEAQPGLASFRVSDPGVALHPFPSTDPFVGYAMLAADDERLYWANGGGLSRTTFVGAFTLSPPQASTFPEGRSVCLNPRPGTSQCYEGHSYTGVIDLASELSQAPTGLAVQRHGRLLAVAHGGLNLVRLFDKTRGTLVGQISVPLAAKGVNQLAITPSGDLWVASGNSVLRYTDLERSPRVAATIEGLQRPLALATSPSGEEDVWVADGGPSQQVKRYDTAGRLRLTVGQDGGYANDPRVADDKLCFKGRDGKEQTALAIGPDRAVWVVDTCNNRLLRFRTDGLPPWRGDLQVAYLPAFYASTVDHGNPTRVFANFLEFSVDATPLSAQRWTLQRNWLAGLPAALADNRSFNGAFGGFTSVETLANGRTYGLLTAQGRQMIVELPASGPLRVVKALAAPLPGATAKVLYENGELGHALTGSGTQTVLRQAITGFDANNDPVWSTTPVTLASVPLQPGSPHYRNAFSGMPPRFPVTASGQVVFFDQSVRGNEGFHLGAARLGDTRWSWQASPTGPMDGKGSFQTWAIDRSLTYGGNAVWAHGRHIVYGYHGEFYKDLRNGKIGQANQFMHFDDSGLFLGQFGTPSTQPAPASLAGVSGNAFSPTLVRHGNQLFLYHNDESTHAGVHRWRIDGWNDVQELRGSGAAGEAIELR